jgi:hypothetical protein
MADHVDRTSGFCSSMLVASSITSGYTVSETGRNLGGWNLYTALAQAFNSMLLPTPCCRLPACLAGHQIMPQ